MSDLFPEPHGRFESVIVHWVRFFLLAAVFVLAVLGVLNVWQARLNYDRLGRVISLQCADLYDEIQPDTPPADIFDGECP